VHRSGTVEIVPMNAGYAEWRSGARAEDPDRIWVSDWDDGVFPSADPIAPLIALGLAGALVAATFGPIVGVGAGALASGWLAVRRTRVRCDEIGVSGGPGWRRRVRPRGCGWENAGEGRVSVWVAGGMSGGRGTVPAVLLPAVVARFRRLHGVELRQGPPAPRDRAAMGAAWVADLMATLSVGLVVAAFVLDQPGVPVGFGASVLFSLLAVWSGLAGAALGVRSAPIVTVSALASIVISAGVAALWWAPPG
jgi:hypothetical protein